MKVSNVIKFNFLLICFFIVLSLLMIGESEAGINYYISPSKGSNSNLGTSSNSPWATFSYAMAKLKPGDTLYLNDGIYTESLNVTISGTAGNPITIKAVNDGAVTINGQGARIPLNIYGKSYINIEGIIFTTSSASVVLINGGSTHINLRRISAYNAKDTGLSTTNYHEIEISGGSQNTSDILVEDCIAMGTGRKPIQAYKSKNITIRRCWTRFTSSSSNANASISIYQTKNSLVENNVITQGTVPSNIVLGITLHAVDYPSNDNSFYGNIVYGLNSAGFLLEVENGYPDMSGNAFYNNAIINSRIGLEQQGDINLIMNNLTVANATGSPGVASYDRYTNRGLTIKNSNIFNGAGYGLSLADGSKLTGYIHDYNNLYNNSKGNYSGESAGAHDKSTNPAYDTATYGNGAYLIRPSNLATSGEGGKYIGAEVLYRYEEGVLTNTPLWPWPMEGRICMETGYSVTYKNGYSGCLNGGGLWKTLDGVYLGDQVKYAAPPNPPYVLE